MAASCASQSQPPLEFILEFLIPEFPDPKRVEVGWIEAYVIKYNKHCAILIINPIHDPDSRFSMVTQSKPLADRPVNEKRFADDFVLRKIAPVTRIQTVHC